MASSFKPRRPWSNRPSSSSFAFGQLLRRILAVVLLVALVWTVYVVHQINKVARQDQAQAADAIAVFGAAEYSGRPSPVYHARLDHALSLYQKKVAPVVITLGGGSDKDSGKTEGGVGRDYLLAQGVPFTRIIAETHSFSTSQQARRLAEIARVNHFQHLVVVSDPTHLFRIQQFCRSAGLEVYTSPRRSLGRISDYERTLRYAHEILSYTILRLHLANTRLYRWLDGKSDD